MQRLSVNQVLDAAETLDDDIGLDNVAIETLQAICQRLGQSARGTRKELAKRIRKQYLNSTQ